MRKLSVIILSYAVDYDIYQMNIRCLDSLFKSESWQDGDLEVLLMESNKNAAYTYDERVKVIVPDEKFNFHRFLNLGMEQSNGEWLAFCNNDIVFTQSWFSAILAVKAENPGFMCFSPYDHAYPMMAELCCPAMHDYEIGWENKKHFAAWCFVWQRKVFDIIGKFDEAFDFYSADDDELMTLRKYAIPNVLVTASEVRHLSQVVTKKVDSKQSPAVLDKEKYPLSHYEIKRGLSWLWSDVRFYDAYQRMKAKWGNEQMLKRVHRMLDRFPFFRKRIITKLLYNKTVINILARITGIRY